MSATYFSGTLDAVAVVKPFYNARPEEVFTVGFEFKCSKSDLMNDEKMQNYLPFVDFLIVIIADPDFNFDTNVFFAKEEQISDWFKKTEHYVNIDYYHHFFSSRRLYHGYFFNHSRCIFLDSTVCNPSYLGKNELLEKTETIMENAFVGLEQSQKQLKEILLFQQRRAALMQEMLLK